MRIPSQFNDSSLYRPRRGENNARKRPHVPGGSDTRRRLIRLAAALLLVIVVMREARRPGLYQTFFGAQRADWVAVESKPAGPNSPQVSTPDSGPPEAPARKDPDQPIPDTSHSGATPPGDGQTQPKQRPESQAEPWAPATAWVDEMGLPLQRAWIESLLKIRRSQDQQTNPPATDASQADQWTGLSVEQIDQSGERITELAQSEQSPRLQEVVDGIAAMRQAAQSGRIPSDLWTGISHWAVPLLDQLDREALGRVSDGTFWTGADSDAFFLQLLRADELRREEGQKTGTLPLLQQPDIYQGHTIALDGTLQLAQQVDAKQNRFEVDSYWKLWVIPSDGGIRPTVLITPSLPESVTKCLTADGSWDRTASEFNPDGEILAVGRFIKRLPYRSSIGADLAPVLIGRLVAVKGDSRTARSAGATSDAEAGDANADGGSGLLGIWLAVAAGIGIAAVLMVRTSIDAKRSRRLRSRSLEFDELKLDELQRKDSNNPRSQDSDPTAESDS